MAGNSPMAPAMSLALAANFGSVGQWRAALCAVGPTGEAASRIALVFLAKDGTLANRRLSSLFADDVILLEIDATAGDDNMAGIEWAQVHERYQHAVHDASEPFGASADELDVATLLDVRRAGVFEGAATMIPGARWLDPGEVGQWASEFGGGQEVIVYCVYGHEVGRATALRLRSRGVSARFLRGGIDGWQAAGRPLAAK